MSDTASIDKRIKYIYDLPIEVFRKLGYLLDFHDEWKDLGYLLDFHNKWKDLAFVPLKLDRIGKAVLRRESPTEELLWSWGHENHTVLELFLKIKETKKYDAMEILRPFVAEEYHHLIPEGISRIDLDSADKVRTLIELNGDARSTEINGSTKSQKQNTKLPPSNPKNPSSEENRGPVDFAELGSGLPFINYKELEQATNSWNRNNILGRGGFGVVFKGVVKQTVMAIKRLEPQKGNELEFNALEGQRQQLFKELKYLNENRHDNILPLYGYSFGEEKCCLVYQFMPNGSLEDRIQCRHGSLPLSWFVRYTIARGTARGLQFLHSREHPLVHGDIKSANILLDNCWEPKIGDFGLAREGPTANYTHINVSHVHGTRPYLPDEFLRGKKFSTKVDTYSFGVVLFEIATGLRAYEDSRSEKFLRDYIYNYNEEMIQEVIDPKIGSENFALFKIIIELGKKCVVQRARDRPKMIDVSKELDKILVDRDSFLRAMSRRTSLLPWTGSYHPEQRMFATPPASIPVSIQPLGVPNRQSPLLTNPVVPPMNPAGTPTNPAVPALGLREVSEENTNETYSTETEFETETSSTEPSPPNIQGVPNKSVFKPVYTESQMMTSSASPAESEIPISLDEPNEQNPVETPSEMRVDISDDYLPDVSLLQNGGE